MPKLSRIHFSSKKDEWETPQGFFDALNKEFNFTLDAAATRSNAKCNRFLCAGSLDLDWASIAKCQTDGHTGAVWLNPPYGRQIGRWLAKAQTTAKQGTTVVCLLPARTDTKWWHEYVWDGRRHRPYKGVEVRLIQGRLKFGGNKDPAPFPSVVVVFRGQ